MPSLRCFASQVPGGGGRTRRARGIGGTEGSQSPTGPLGVLNRLNLTEPAPFPRVSVLTLRNSEHGLRLLNVLRAENIPVQQVVVLDAVWRTRVRWLRRWVRQLGVPNALLFAAWGFFSRVITSARLGRQYPIERGYARLAVRVDYAPFPRSPATVSALQDGQPDILLLAESGIVPRSVLAVPRIATLNAHPGILPEFRGLDPELWAIEKGCPDRLGCTLHLVDAGVDTGPIIRVEPYTWRGDETLDRVVDRLNRRCLQLLVGACRAPWPATRDGAVPQGPGATYRLMTLGQRIRVAGKVRAYARIRGQQ